MAVEISTRPKVRNPPPAALPHAAAGTRCKRCASLHAPQARMTRSTTSANKDSGAPPRAVTGAGGGARSEEHTSELQSQSNLVCRLLLEKKKNNDRHSHSISAHRDDLQRAPL